MTQMADTREVPRPQYPPQDYSYAAHSMQPSPPRQESSREDGRAAYPPPDPARQGQYPHGPPPPSYHQPPHWAGQPPYAPPSHHYDPNHPPYQYPPPNGQPSQPMQPDPYRLPPPYPPHAYYPPPSHYQTPPAPAPRQRTAIACKYCRKRKIRCSGYDSSPDGRCQNCVRFNQQCLFHPVSSQAAFVPASAVYGPNARASISGQPDGRPSQNGQSDQPMLYGAHGQPLGPAGPGGQPQYGYHSPHPPSTNSPPPAGLTPQSAHSFNSPRLGHPDGKHSPPNIPLGTVGIAQNGRSGMKVHEMLGNPTLPGAPPEQRGKSDSDMLNKLNGKK